MIRFGMAPEDIAWLETQLGIAAVGAAPRGEFVARTKTAVLEGRVDDPEANAIAAAFVVTAIAAAAAGAAAALLHFLTRRRAR